MERQGEKARQIREDSSYTDNTSEAAHLALL